MKAPVAKTLTSDYRALVVGEIPPASDYRALVVGEIPPGFRFCVDCGSPMEWRSVTYQFFDRGTGARATGVRFGCSEDDRHESFGPESRLQSWLWDPPR